MKNAFLLLLAISLLGSSCTNLLFEKPQPEDGDVVKSIPAEYHGRFVGNITSPNNHDTLVIDAQSINHQKRLFEMGKNLEVRQTKEYYWVNLLTDQPNQWAVIVVYPAKENAIEIKPLTLKDGREKKLATLTQVKQLGNDTYSVNPSKKEMKKIMKEGIFNEKIILKRIP